MKQPKRQKTSSVFTENFNRVLKERGLTLKMASELMNLPYSTVADWANNATVPNNIQAVFEFCRKLNLDFQWLLTGTRSNANIADVPLSELFDEESVGFEGIYRLSAVRLTRKKSEKKNE